MVSKATISELTAMANYILGKALSNDHNMELHYILLFNGVKLVVVVKLENFNPEIIWKLSKLNLISLFLVNYCMHV